MYGLLCESLHDFIKESYGDDVWKLVRERADVRLHSFVTHQVRWSHDRRPRGFAIKTLEQNLTAKCVYAPLCASRCTARV